MITSPTEFSWWADPDYDVSGELIGEEIDYDWYDPIEEEDWERSEDAS